MERQIKNITGEVKELNEQGEGLIKFATLNVIDSDEDVTIPGAFGEQTAPIVPAHDWSQAPIGKAKIREDGDSALAEIKLNLKTDQGRNWYEALKFDMENPPSKQEYSYGYDVLDSERGEHKGRSVRFLKKLKVHEVSPVLLGAGVVTVTLGLKVDCKNCKVKKGARLASTLNRLIENSDSERAEVIASMGSSAGIDANTVNQILNGSIDCPPLRRLQGFARALGTSLSTLRSAAESDGCEYSGTSSLEEDVQLVKECTEKLIARVTGIKELREQDDREISKERIKELLEIEKLLIGLKHLCETPKDEDVAKLVSQFQDIETRMFDMKRDMIERKRA